MMKEALIKKAKKYKKWLEKFDVTAFSYEVNGVNYYFAYYIKGKDVTGYAIISDKEERSADIEIAFKKLQSFANLSSNIFGSVRQLASVSPEYFFDIANVVPSNSDDDVLLKGKQIFNEQGELQSKLVELYKNYETHYGSNVGKSLKVTDEEIEYLLVTLATSDILQYEQSKLLINEYSLLKEFQRKLKQSGFIEKLQINRVTFLKELTSTDPAKKDNIIEQVRYVDKWGSLPFDRQLEELIRYSKEDRESKQNEYLKKIRYPKI